MFCTLYLTLNLVVLWPDLVDEPVYCFVLISSCLGFRFRGLTLLIKVLSARSLSRKKLIASQGLRKGLASIVRYLMDRRFRVQGAGCRVFGEREGGGEG